MPQTPANDRIQFALIGAGGMGSGDTVTALSLGGTQLVAVSDVYRGRLARARERWGRDLPAMPDYREVLARKDVDAVFVATPDHWHARIAREALAAGKDVYCQKPMVHSLDEGHGVIQAQQSSGRILQVGSQYVSSMVYIKARDLLAQGAIGELNLVEAWLDRNSAIGAWQYSIPPDASPATIDWERFLGHAPKRPFEAVRLFRWRNYRDYGTGVAGDLFVHLLSGLHFVVNSAGPERVYATGGVRFWQDGRDAADVMLAVLDYPKTDAHPAFTLTLKVNLASGGSAENFGFRFVGSEGVMQTGFTTVTVSRTPRETEPGYTVDTFAQATQDRFLREYREKYPPRAPNSGSIRPAAEHRYTAPSGYSAHRDHHINFFNAVRSRKPFLEDGVFGFRAAGPALLCNVSLAERRPCGWKPDQMVRTS